MKENRNIKLAKGHLKRAKKSANRATNQVLIVLWCSTFLLLAFMILRWNRRIDASSDQKEKTSSIFLVDDVLLSSSDLKLNTTSSLINISLNSEPASRFGKNDQKQARSISRDELYKNIFNQKIKKAESKPKGFTMKPLPE